MQKKINSKYEDYRDINQKEKSDVNNDEPSMLPIHEQLSNLDLN